ncbi:amino acid permease-domain-containing protein [Stachybotrys elegans]|uniref:Amino acid permease-domain-containing protein n=1 Tax=Stachybotrys elegans TaxID=80388 RepID=A0A8K0WXC4_9HYPO|nr:amino acid permease-domain-containing protein [Stachybotrys elegans]
MARDIELHNFNTFKLKEESLHPGSSFSMREPDYEEPELPGFRDRFFESFKRHPDSDFFAVDHLSQPSQRMHNGAHYYDLRQATLESAHTTLSRKLKSRHLQMIAIGGSIGTGLFVASGTALATGGPGSLLLAFSFVGTMLYCTCQALGELAVMFPIAGSFSSWATRFLDPSWGFAMGWNYALQWLCILPLEVVAAAHTLRYWGDSQVSAIFVTIFLGIILGINMFGIKGFGEAEFIFSMVKVIAVIGFILLGIVLNVGGTPDGGYIGTTYWSDPGAFNNGFQGFCDVLVTAAFSFTGTELVGLAAAETANPRKSVPTAIKQVFWRITIFYILSLALVGLLVPYNHAQLNNPNSSEVDAAASPFVIAIEAAGIQVLPDVMNAVILIAVLSVGNSSVFGSSRTLAALANMNQAPKILAYIDRKGRPLVAIGIAGVFGLLGYLADLPQQGNVIDWLLAISGLSTIFTWGSICLCHIRFRRAWAARGRSLSDIPFRSQVGVWGSWVGLVGNCCVLVSQFWVGASPIDPMSPSDTAQNFFLKLLGLPIIIGFYICHKMYYGTSFVPTRDMDVDTGRRDFNLPILVAQERDERAAWPRWKRFYKWLC